MESVISNLRQGMSGTYDKKTITVDSVNGTEYIPTSTLDMGQKRIDFILLRATIYMTFG
jgi:endonuclease V-like protein UPF0215 family